MFCLFLSAEDWTIIFPQHWKNSEFVDTGRCFVKSYQKNISLYLILKDFFFFLKRTIFKVFIESVTVLLLFHVSVFLAARHVGSYSPTRDRTHIPCIERRSLDHGTAREVPKRYFLCTGM